MLLVPISRRRKAERLLGEAGIQPAWGGTPTADDIRKLDEERLLSDPILVQENGEDDLAVAKALLERHSAEDLAAALARVWRARLPAPDRLQRPMASLRWQSA